MPEKALDGESAGMRVFRGVDWLPFRCHWVSIRQSAIGDRRFVGSRARPVAFAGVGRALYRFGLGHPFISIINNFTGSLTESASI
jgi:hypothetical protein